MSPYQQGELDGLCGVYSIINAMRLIFREMSEVESMFLFKSILQYVESRKRLSSTVVRGLTSTDINLILKKVVRPLYPIIWSRPFILGRSYMGVFWKELKDFVDEDEGRTAILILDYNNWNHFTVIHRISQRQLRFFDSSFSLWSINRSRCTVSDPTRKRPCRIDMVETFFISKCSR